MNNYKLSDKIDFSPGRVVYEDWVIQSDLALREQLLNLKEDLLQVEFTQNLVLDVGWFPSFDPQGKFQIRLVHNFDWEQPVFLAETQELDELVTVLAKAVILSRDFHCI